MCIRNGEGRVGAGEGRSAATGAQQRRRTERVGPPFRVNYDDLLSSPHPHTPLLRRVYFFAMGARSKIGSGRLGRIFCLSQGEGSKGMMIGQGGRIVVVIVSGLCSLCKLFLALEVACLPAGGVLYRDSEGKGGIFSADIGCCCCM